MTTVALLTLSCIAGMTVKFLFKDEEERIGANALIVAFVLGVLVQAALSN